MFERHFGLRENPFAAGHQSRFVYPSREHQEALAHLRFGIENREPFVLITGEVGTGKTTALYDVLGEYESRAVVALITNSSLTRDELLEEICLRFGLPTSGSVTKPQALAALERFLRQTRARGRHAILILDEAQNLERALLEEIRLLSNLEEQGNKLIQLFLVGQPELEDKLARPELRQLRQRITVFYRLNPLTVEDTERYIHHRIAVAGGHAISIFPADACRDVFAVTHGIPREINTVAGQAMLNAFVDDSPVVLPQHVRTVERDNEFKSVLRGGAGGARISTLDSASPQAAAAQPQQRAPEPAAAAPQQRAPEPAAAPDPAPVAGSSTHGSRPEPAARPAEAPPAPPARSFEPPAPYSAPVASAPDSSSVPHGQPPLHPSEPIAASTSTDPRPVPAALRTPPSPAAAPTAFIPPGADAPPITEDEPVETKPSDSQQPPKRPGAVAPAGTAQAWGDWLSSLAQLPSVFEEAEAEKAAAAAEQADAAAAGNPGDEAAAAAGSPAQTVAGAPVGPEYAGSAPTSAAMSTGAGAGTPPASPVSAATSAGAAASSPARAEAAAHYEAPAATPAYREPVARAEVAPPAAAPTHIEPPARIYSGPPRLEVEPPGAFASRAAPDHAEPPARFEPPPQARVEPESRAETASHAAPADSETLPGAPAPATPISRVEALRRSMRDQWPPVFSDTPESAEASRSASASRADEAATTAAGAKSAPSERTARASRLFGSEDESAASRRPRRLEFLDEEPTAENGKPLRLLATVAIVAVVAIAGALGIRAWIRAAKPAGTDSHSTVSSAAAPTPVETSPTATGTTSATGAPTATTPAPQATTPAREPAVSATPPSAARQPTHSSTTTSGPPVASSAASPARSTSGAPGTATTGSAGPPATSGAQGGAAGAAAGGAAAGAAAGTGGAAGGAAAGAASGASGVAASAGGAAAAPASSAATETPARSAPATQGAYGIAVGTYLNEERAEEERAKLAESTQLPAKVVPVAEDGDTVYRLVLGSFATRQLAERSASSLIERGLVDEARVVPLTTTTASKP